MRCSFFALFLFFVLTPSIRAEREPGLEWIWFPEADEQADPPSALRYFRRVFEIDGEAKSALLHITCDNEYRVSINGEACGAGARWEEVDAIDVRKLLRDGRNVIAVEAKNHGGPAGLVAQLVVELASGGEVVVLTDKSWRTNDEEAPGWREADFAGGSWREPRVIKEFGSPGLWSGSRWLESPGEVPYEVPEGFSIAEVASHLQIGSAVAFTFDGEGRPIVSREGGPVQVAVDADGDGAADEIRVFTDRVTNCQGLCSVGDALYAVGNGPSGTGLYRLEDRDGDDAADTVELVTRYRGGMGEHGPHAVVYGPDGWLYLAIGNHAFLGSPVDPKSPHRNYAEDEFVPVFLDAGGHARGVRAPGGTVFRHRIGSETFSLFCGGFRNHYDIDFDARGEMFTFDSDMEWDVNLPWYRPVRVNHCIPGGEYGWRTGSGKWPEHYFDSLPSTHDVGRGSPTGVVFYHHRQFPEKYRGAFFICDWSMGRILAIFPRPSGSTYAAREEEFVTGRPLNVTDIAVGPEGALYFTVGGRGTRGGLYRVLCDGRPPETFTPPRTVAEALAGPQPGAAWARRGAGRLRRELGEAWDRELARATFDPSLEPALRLRAIDLREQHGPAVTEEEAVRLARDGRFELRARAAWLLGDRPGPAAQRELVRLLGDGHPLVARRACEGLVRQGLDRDEALPEGLAGGLVALLSHPERWVRFAARVALERVPASAWKERVVRSPAPRVVTHGLLAWCRSEPESWEWKAIGSRAADLLEATEDIDVLLEALRVIEVAKARGDGLDPGLRERLGAWAIARFPSIDWRLNRELALFLGYCRPPGARAALLAEQKTGASREQQIHYAYSLRLIGGEWSDAEIRDMASWFGPAFQWTGGNSFRGYIEYFWSAWLEKLPEAERARLKRKKAELAKVELPVETAPQPGAPSFDEVLAFLEKDPRAREGDRERGREVYEKAGCNRCHRFGDAGEGAGPDLTTVSSRFRTEEILESIYYPSRVISDQYRGAEIVTTEGEVLLGMPIFEDDDQLILVKTDGTRATIEKKTIASRAVPRVSVMPEGLLNPLDLEEIADLFAFLTADSRR